jgi:hypothetical protein
MAKLKRKNPEKRPLTPEERENVGKWTRRITQAVREFEKQAGKEVTDEELRPWNEISDEDREIYRKAGEAIAGGMLLSEQYMWERVMPQVRAEMGEKAFRRKLFSICIEQAVQGIAPHLSELEHHKTVESIMGLSKMLEVPKETDEASEQTAAIKQQLDRIERYLSAKF